jgi:hypothetical protein
MWLVNAEWLLIQIISRNGEGSGAASHANIAKLAATAFSPKVVGIPQLIENQGVLPDVGECLFLQISGQRWQISTRINLSLMRNETYCGPC